jgi:glutamate-1-semialdehyde 2,1-aminomutase
VRATNPYPVYIERADGAYIYDVDGNEYVDFWNNHGASILGHTPDGVVEAVREQAADGLHYGTMNEPTLELGRRIVDHVPSAERIRFCASGTEATMYAARLARAHTGNDEILKLTGGWHGGNTDLAIDVYPPYDEPTTHGLPAHVRDSCLAVEDVDAMQDVFETHGGDVAAVIVDPHMGGVEPSRELLDFLSDVTERDDTLLIFDEVVTGFRVSPGTYQERTGVTPELTTLGKIVGGGMPVGALCGRADLFEPAVPGAEPDERVIAGGGTFSANPMTAVAGLALLDTLESEPVYERTERVGARIRDELASTFEREDVPCEIIGFSSLFNPVIDRRDPIESAAQLRSAGSADLLDEFHTKLYARGYYFNQGSSGKISFAITDDHVEGFLDAAGDVLREMKRDGALS